MITINKVSKNYNKRVLLKNVSLTVNPGEKIGLLGPNGAGKSTLFSMMLGEIEPSGGYIHINKNTRIGYLPQEANFNSTETVLEEIVSGDKEIKQLNKEREELEKNNNAVSGRYGEILDRLESLGYFELEHKAKKILAGLEFKDRDFKKNIRELSGGWQMRVLLAKLLTCHYDILLLDEPTNYLDLNAAIWFKDFLANFKGTFIIISHDKVFLNEVTNYTLILENGEIFKVKGNYEHYEQIKEEKKKFLTKQYKEQEKKRQGLEKFIARFHGQPNKAAQVRSKKTALKKMEDIAVPADQRESIRDFRFPDTKQSGYKVINLEGIYKSYTDIKVYENLDFEVTKGEKAVLAGENGAGKSTLLKIMAGVVAVDKGRRDTGHNVEIGYFSQTRLDILNPDNTVLSEAYAAAAGFMSQTEIRTILGAFLFSGDDVDKNVRILSGGEKSRLILAKLLINPPNCLLLDEPTTHLDVDAVDALVRALKQYEGTIVFISHDIHFVQSVANVVYEVKEGKIRKFPGNFKYYLDKKASEQILINDNSPDSKTVNSLKKIEQRKSKEEESKRLEEEENRKNEKRKNHNKEFRRKIQKLQSKKEKLQLERYAKTRVLSSPRRYLRDIKEINEYEMRIKQIDTILSEIDNEIPTLQKMLL